MNKPTANRQRISEPPRRPATRNTPGFTSQLYNYLQLMRLHKPIGIWLLLWPTLWALWLAGKGHPNPGVFVVFVLGVIIMRSAGCVLNDLVDRNIDPYVERTRFRPIASGAVTTIEGITLFIALGLIAIGLAAMLNRPAQLLAVIGAALTIVYPFIKRYISIPQFVLGAAFGWAVPMAFAAQTGSTPQLAWLVFVTALIWAVIYDTFYAMVDRDDDIKVGVKSTAILFGDADLFVIGGLQALMLMALVFTGQMAQLGLWYYMSVGVAALLMAYHQWLARDRKPVGCFAAFQNNHVIGLVIFVGIVLHYTFTSPPLAAG
ncbi:MAG: 4-hydroxybenzoate octaprenyltransferase [Gammaproteobacteria bacterium]|nr:4-hydroxybenzoate octaprenyltransferase [Gammaproteobacteria bacterium]